MLIILQPGGPALGTLNLSHLLDNLIPLVDHRHGELATVTVSKLLLSKVTKTTLISHLPNRALALTPRYDLQSAKLPKAITSTISSK